MLSKTGPTARRRYNKPLMKTAALQTEASQHWTGCVCVPSNEEGAMSNEPMRRSHISLMRFARNPEISLSQYEKQAVTKLGNRAGKDHCSFFIAHCPLSGLLRTSLACLLILLCSAPASAQTFTFGEEAKTNPSIYKPDFVHDSTFEFGIFDKGGKRVATAYYRILKEETEGRKVWRFKYVGRNEGSSESSECWVDIDNLQPIRSTRKVVYNNQTYYSDVAYQDTQVVVREKRDEMTPSERAFALAKGTYDYEEIMWLIPLLDFGDGKQVKISVFDSLNLLPLTVTVQDDGIEPIHVQQKEYSGHKYSFNIQSSPYKLWSVIQDGREVPAIINMGDTEFVNLELTTKKESKRKARSSAATQP